MGNILLDRLPESVEINGREYSLDTDFRSCLRIILAFEDLELATIEKRAVLLENLYMEKPEDLEEAFYLGMDFLDGGEGNPDSQAEAEPTKLYSFSKDSKFIFSAFRQTHGVDLETVDYLHWWKFLYLFMDLGENTFFIRLLGLRKRLADGTASKEDRRAAREMEDLITVPQNRTMELEEMESVNRFMELMEKGEHDRQENQS